MDLVLFNWRLAFSRYAEFNGRSSRAEYWHFTAVQVVLYLATVLATLVVPIFIVGWLIFALGTLVPWLAASARRLRDTGRSPLLLLLLLIPFVGTLAILVLCAMESVGGAPAGQTPPKRTNCGKCGAKVGLAAQFCPSCGTSFGTRFCPQCGSKMDESESFCSSCGTATGVVPPPPASPASPASPGGPGAGRRRPVLPAVNPKNSRP
jgi:uncharacterized membrane protein YhaH (DUF805 family)